MNRRQFIKGLGALTLSAGGILLPAAGLFLPETARAQEGTADAFWKRDRILHVKRLGLGERISVRYFRNGQYDNEAYGRICWLFRDFKDQNRWKPIDVDLIDSMWAVQEWTRQEQSQEPLWELTSAYRTSRRNATIEGAAFNSYHTRGMGIDGRIKGSSLQAVAEKAAHFKVGGIGQYRTFVHLDSGPVRTWVRA